MPSPSLHAVLSPSSAKRWLTCPPSARLGEKLNDRFGQKDSAYAREGTQAHALGEIKIRNALWHLDKMTNSKFSRLDPVEQEAYQGINDHRYEALRDDLGEIPTDMEKATDTYCDVVMERLASARAVDPATKLFLEQRLDLSQWAPASFGSSDCVLVSDSLLEVIDYKHGLGIPVSAEHNPQLRLYALGGIAKYGDLYDFTKVRYTIVQPRLDNLSAEDMERDALLQWAEEEVKPKAQLAWTGKGEFLPGDHCRFCPAKAVCAARVAEAMEMFRYGFEAAGILPDEQIPEVLNTLDVAEAWIKDIRAYAESMALKGQRWKGWKLVRGKKPNRTWTDPEAVKAELLRSGYNESVFEETKLKPVGEMEKLLGKSGFRAILGDLVHQGEGKLILVPESDKRIEYTSAEAAFADLTT